ncbi:60S ribosomal protein L10 [Cricetulus griseus]|uniref:60S ribosomal protein L10 n=1 Tax=Cricetulus griseus TaxID=10029 RepID=G3HY53_CRIGR|nr:60S ribosomal protein L10 [Cricetulus griseus]
MKKHVMDVFKDKFKFPGHRKSHISKNWGFTKFNEDAFEDTVSEKWLILYGDMVTHMPNCGILDKWCALPFWGLSLC